MSVSSLPLGPEPEEPARLLPLLDTQRDYAQHCSLIAAYTHVKVNVKNTRTRAWYRLAGGPPLNRARSVNGQAVRAANRRNLRLLEITGE